MTNPSFLGKWKLHVPFIWKDPFNPNHIVWNSYLCFALHFCWKKWKWGDDESLVRKISPKSYVSMDWSKTQLTIRELERSNVYPHLKWTLVSAKEPTYFKHSLLTLWQAVCHTNTIGFFFSASTSGALVSFWSFGIDGFILNRYVIHALVPASTSRFHDSSFEVCMRVASCVVSWLLKGQKKTAVILAPESCLRLWTVEKLQNRLNGC